LDAFGILYSLTDEEIEQLKFIGVTGEMTVVGRSVHGRGEKSRAVIVMQQQVDKPVELSQPDKVKNGGKPAILRFY